MDDRSVSTDGDVKSVRDRHVWREGIHLVTKCYQVTKSFPSDERFGLVNQMRGTAVSVPANIADRSARESTREYRRFLAIDNGSLAKLETQFEVSVALNYRSAEPRKPLHEDMDRLGRKLNRLQQSLKNKL